MSHSIQSSIPSHSNLQDTPVQGAEAMHPDAVALDTPNQTSNTTADSQAASERPQVSVSDVLLDPTSAAYSFMQKAQACLERGDSAGYFAYHDHAMTWAQTEASARNA